MNVSAETAGNDVIISNNIVKNVDTGFAVRVDTLMMVMCLSATPR